MFYISIYNHCVNNHYITFSALIYYTNNYIYLFKSYIYILNTIQLANTNGPLNISLP